jgi:hypothetical protein
MGEAARHDEECECPENPSEIDVAPLRYKNGKRNRYGKIGGGNDGIGGDMKPDQFRLP